MSKIKNIQSAVIKFIGVERLLRLRRYNRQLKLINELGPSLQALTDESLQQKSRDLRKRARNGVPLHKLLCEAYALVREASQRMLGLRHFDVQLLGAMALHEGLIVEMTTGEGKTLVATLPVYLNALTGRGVHVITVNDYLAQRDAEWMGPLYCFLGLSVGVILEEMGEDEADEIRNRRAAYQRDITYGTNHEITFDYLRDNLTMRPDEIVHREFNYVIIDEADLLLIDEAGTPLVISSPIHEGIDSFQRVDRIVRGLVEGIHYVTEARTRTASLTDAGIEAVQNGLDVDNLFNIKSIHLYHAVYQSVLAHGAYKCNVDYIVEDGEVFIVDDFTGRISMDKRFADGLHQAIEAKEGVSVQSEDQTLAQITYQTFFGRYRKLAGMTGTALAEKKEFVQTYGRDVQVIPANKSMIRVDYLDLVFNTLEEKHKHIVKEILNRKTNGQPVLVGTSSVKESEQLSHLLNNHRVHHSVLNARNHRAEAVIIAQAGRKGAVTISTNMAGRGTDIILGGNPEMISKRIQTHKIEKLKEKYTREQMEVLAAGGLHVIGTAHHDSTRIDDQLRGRAGRQGDPGSSQFIVSLDDEIWKKFGETEIEKIRADLRQNGHSSSEPIESWSIKQILKKQQKKINSANRAIRRDVLKYDLVVHVQRETIYEWRRRLLSIEGFEPDTLIRDVIKDIIGNQQDNGTLADRLRVLFNVAFKIPEDITESGIMAAEILNKALSLLQRREEIAGKDALYEIGRRILLKTIDEIWTEHLTNLEGVEEGIDLWSYAEIDPLSMWCKETSRMWEDLLRHIRYRAVSLWFMVDLRQIKDHVTKREVK